MQNAKLRTLNCHIIAPWDHAHDGKSKNVNIAAAFFQHAAETISSISN
jgi:hypothetical protein